MKRIFISYKRDDKGKVFPIKDYIERNVGETCWIDLEGIESDAQFKSVIRRAVNNAVIFLFFYSYAHTKIKEENYDNDWTIREYNYAVAKKKRIVFINVDGSPLTDPFLFDFEGKEQIDATSEESMQSLYRDLRKWLDVEITKKRTEDFFSYANEGSKILHEKMTGSEHISDDDSSKAELDKSEFILEAGEGKNGDILWNSSAQEKIDTKVIVPENEKQIEVIKKELGEVAKCNAETKRKVTELETDKEVIRYKVDKENREWRERTSKWRLFYDYVLDNKWLIFIFLGSIVFILLNVFFSKGAIYDEKEWPEITEQQFESGLLESVHLLESEQKKEYSFSFRKQEKDTFLVFVCSLRDKFTNQIKNDCALIKIAKDIQPKYVVGIRKTDDLVSFAFCKPDEEIKTFVVDGCFANGSIHSRILLHHKGERDIEHGNTFKNDILEIIPPNFKSKIEGVGSWYEIPPQLPLSDDYQSISFIYIVRHAINKGLKWMIWGGIISILLALLLLWEKYKGNNDNTYGSISFVAIFGTILSLLLGYIWCFFQYLMFIIDYWID